MSIACPLTRLSISHANHVATGKSTRPRGARLRRTICDFWSRNFNPRARMGRDKRSTPSSSSGASFNSRARLGRDLHRVDGEHDVVVSIHAPAWGATIAPERQAVSALVSIHAPAWGATRGSCRCPRRSRCFNPRARVGRDPKPEPVFAVVVVLIHAPAWGATQVHLLQLVDQHVSIHAPAWGAT